MAGKAKQAEIDISGPGVAPVKDRKLDSLCDKFVELKDNRATITEEIGDTEAMILDRMGELGIKVHKFGDQIATIKDGKRHVKTKLIRTDNGEVEDDDKED